MAKRQPVRVTAEQRRVLRSIDQLGKRSEELSKMLQELSVNLRELTAAPNQVQVPGEPQRWIGPWCPPPPPGGKNKKKR